MNLVELTDLTGETPRQVRFLISEGFVPSPTGGRARASYGDAHVAAIRRYQALRAAGFKPAAIRLLTEGGGPVLIPLAPGLTLHLDPTTVPAGLDPHAVASQVEALLTAHLAATPKENSDAQDDRDHA